MQVDTASERFQLAVADKFGNVIPETSLAFTNVAITGDPTLASITGSQTDTSLFDVAPTGKIGTDSINLSANVSLNGAAPVALTGSLTLPLTPGNPAQLTAVDQGPTPAASAAAAAAKTS
jgi:hypothetical protein